jgi:pyruvate dehydrogenase E2 component (dihydrolipoamide acetyltransferase)
MPRLGLTMTEGTVVEWHARAGEAVERGKALLVVESEKAQVEVEAFASGVLGAIYVEPGTTVSVGALLGAVVAPGEAFDREAFQASFVPDVPGAPATARAGAARPAAAPPPPAAMRSPAGG